MEIAREKGNFFVYNDEGKYVTTISIASWDEFEATVSILTKRYKGFRKRKNWTQSIAKYLAENQSDDYLDFLPFVYLWALQTGDKEAISIFETRIFPEVACYISIQPGTRWIVAFDNHLKAGKRYEIIESWLREEVPATYLERRERWVALHSLFSVSDETEPKIQEKIYSSYTDFLKEGQNRDIEEFFGNTIEADFIELNKERSKRKRREDEMGWFLKNWLMRRYSVKEVATGWKWGILILVGIGIIMICVIVFFRALKLNGSTSPFLYDLLHSSTLWGILFLIGYLGLLTSLFLTGWIYVGKYLSRLIWGSVIGWILFFSGALTDVIHSKYEGAPQILRLNDLETFLFMLVFLAIVLFIVYREVEGAHIKRSLIRAGEVVFIGLYFSSVIGAILTSVVSWYFPMVKCWFNRWYLMVLAVGTPLALTVGVITQLIWESRRITEMVRK